LTDTQYSSNITDVHIEFGASRVGNSLAPQWLEEFDRNYWYDRR
jgi:hypothetical protein